MRRLLLTLPFLYPTLALAQVNDWSTSGNAGTAGQGVIGTTDPAPLRVKTDNVDRVVVEAGGDVRVARLSGNGYGLVAANGQGTLLKVDPGLDSLFDCTVKLWRANGNFITPDCFIGSTNPEAFRVFTHNTERMRVTPTGLVGIGTTQPQAQLHVSSPGSTTLLLESGGGSAADLVWRDGSATHAVLRGQHNAGLGRSELSVLLNTGSSANAVQQVMRLDAQSGELSTRLGIGMACAAQDRLSIAGRVHVAAANPQAGSLALWHDGSRGRVEAGGLGLSLNSGGAPAVFGGSVQAASLALGTGSFSGGGQAFVLSVNGMARVKGLRAYPGWADHVFAPGYALMPLEDLKAYIGAHQHLPGVPSAAEVAAEGIDVGAQQALLLEKVEELTLHVIRLAEENAALRKRVEEVCGE